jgi:YbbR domain-containing protein
MKIRRLFDNIEIKLICLLLAIIMWFYANNPRGTETIDQIMAIRRGDRDKIMFHEVPIELSDSQIRWRAEPSEISVEVKCPTAEIEIGNFQAVVKLTQKDEEERRVTLSAENVELPEGLVFVKAMPSEIRLDTGY